MLETLALISIIMIGVSFFVDVAFFMYDKYKTWKEKKEYIIMCSVPTTTKKTKKGKK